MRSLLAAARHGPPPASAARLPIDRAWEGHGVLNLGAAKRFTPGAQLGRPARVAVDELMAPALAHQIGCSLREVRTFFRFPRDCCAVLVRVLVRSLRVQFWGATHSS